MFCIRSSTLTHPAAVAVFLGALCLGLHHSALSGGWRYDDGAHLYFSLRHAPWQYFFVPDVMREQSWAHFTPWNAFFYEIGLPYFGLNPFGHYAHLLGILWATSLATFCLLRLWISPFSALMGAILFLTMPATGTVAQLLMTGHYAYGLLFSVLVFYFFVRGVRENKISYSFWAAAFYFLVCWSKELYVPIILIMFLLPESNWRERFRHLWPTVIIACIYAIYRLVVLHGIGGYGSYSIVDNTPITAEVITRFLVNMLGSGWNWILIVGYASISLLFALIMQTRKINLFFSLGCCITLIIPITPVIHSDFADDRLRFLFLISWFLAVLLVWFSESGKLSSFALLAVTAILILSQQATVERLIDRVNAIDQEGFFLIDENLDGILLPFELENHMLANLNYLRQATISFNQRTPKSILQDKLELIALGEEIGSKVYQFDEHCKCIRSIGIERYRFIADDFRSILLAGSDQQFSVYLGINGDGFRRRLQWKFSEMKGDYILKIREYDALPITAAGTMNFGAVGAFDQILHVYVQLTSPDGWIARSPVFEIDPRINSQISWNGKSVVK